MKESIYCFGEPILVFAFAPIFVLLFVVIHRVLKEISFFNRSTAVIVALYVALLCVLGLYETFMIPGNAPGATENNEMENAIINFILLPYAALAIAIILLLLLLRLAKIFRKEMPRKHANEAKRRAMETKLYGKSNE